MSPRKPPEVRRRYVLENIATKTIDQIAEECGVTEKTIDRDIAKLKASGTWYSWIEAELLRLHKSPNIDEDIKYREMSKLYARGITEKHEITGETSTTLNIVFDKSLDDDGDTDTLQTP